MPRTPADPIDRSIEKLFAQGIPDASSVAELRPQLNLWAEASDSPMQELVEAASQTQRLHTVETTAGPVWLSGNVVMCCCPECDAPVSVRLWLMVADCWSCGSAMELSYEQQVAAEQLLIQTPHNRPSQAAPLPRRCRPRQQPASASQTLDTLNTEPPPRRLIKTIQRMTHALPAWFISLLFHLVALLVLALILIPTAYEPPAITVSTAISPADEEGGVDIEAAPEVPLEFDTNAYDNKAVERQLKQASIAAAQDARELTLDPDPLSQLPSIEDVKHSVARSPQSFNLAVRDPRLRNEIVKREGGTTLSEAAVSRGLRWLASVQNCDGSWSLAKYRNHDDESNPGDAAATSLALLPFLGAGQTHENGVYRETVAKGLRWLMKHQEADGEITHGIRTNAAIYAHSQAAIVLVEALAMTGDERFREPAQKAINYIEGFQHKHGGWRYRPQEAGDTSVMGWQLMALQSARLSNSGLQVADSTLMLADQFLDVASRPYRSREFRKAPAGTLYRYQAPDSQPKIAMTAEGMLCRMYLGWKRDDGRMNYAVDWLIENALPNIKARKHNLYYYYYATQLMHHYGGKPWEIWNKHLRDLLIIKQARRGKFAGSWDPSDYQYGSSGGRIYATSLAICSLEVYYRHLPLFKKLDLNGTD